MPEVIIDLHNAVTGEKKASVVLPLSETLTQLHAHVTKALTTGQSLTSSVRPRLLQQGKLLSPSSESLEQIGLEPPTARLDFVQGAEPASTRKLGDIFISEEGYHCHHTILKQLPSTDQGSLVLAWWRRYPKEMGCYKAHRHDISRRNYTKADYTTELAFLDVSRLPKRPLAVKTMPDNLEAQVIAVLAGDPLINVTQVQGTRRGRTTELALLSKGADGTEIRRVMWCQDEAGDREVLAHFGGQLRIEQVWISRGKMYAWAGIAQKGRRRNRAEEGVRYLLRANIDLEAGEILFEHWAPVGHEEGHEMDAYELLHFMGTDAEGAHIWFFCGSARAVIVETDTLRVTEVSCPDRSGPFRFSGSHGGHVSWCGLDPLTQDLYFFNDCSPWDPPCRIYRLRAKVGPGAHADDIAKCYQKSKYELICTAQMGSFKAPLKIDSCSDSFCIGAVTYDEKSDSLLIFDAEHGLWGLSLADARYQDALPDIKISLPDV